METIINDIIQQYGSQIWLSFVALVITGFVMILVKNFITDLVYYVKVKMSDLGYGAMIIWDNKLKRVIEIKFKEIKVVDDEEILFIPIKTWLTSVKIYPQPLDKQFNEKKVNK